MFLVWNNPAVRLRSAGAPGTCASRGTSMASMPLKNLPVAKSEGSGLSVEDWKQAFLWNLYYVLGRFPETATLNDKYLALAHSVRERLLDRWVKTSETYYRKKVRTACYMSAEFLLGPHLGNNLLNLGAFDAAKQAMEELGFNFEDMLDQEEEPGLGNGGLGRLAACYVDSEYPACHHALSSPEERSALRRTGANRPLRGQGRARLHDGEADHQADPRRGRRCE